jgi:hypothetical protein
MLGEVEACVYGHPLNPGLQVRCTLARLSGDDDRLVTEAAETRELSFGNKLIDESGG